MGSKPLLKLIFGPVLFAIGLFIAYGDTSGIAVSDTPEVTFRDQFLSLGIALMGAGLYLLISGVITKR